MNIVVLISGEGTNLQAIIDAIENKAITHGKIVAVISNIPAVGGIERAHQHNINTEIVDHRAFDNRLEFDQQLQSKIDQYKPDLLILAGFMRILTDEFVDHYKGKMLNIHPSLLPKYKGLNTHSRVLAARDSEHGCTVHFVSSELDSGAIIAQAKVVVESNDTVDSLSKKVQMQEHYIYPKCIDLFCNQQIKLTDNGVEYQGTLLATQGLDLTTR